MSEALPAKISKKRFKYFNSERRWVLIFGLITMLITTLPYLIGYWAQGDDWRFTGFVFGVEDGNSYLAKMLRGAAGDWLFRTPYSAYNQKGVFFYFPYILLGKLTAPITLHGELIAFYHLFRFAAGVAMILSTYDFLAVFVRGISLKRWGLVFATLGGGLGWLLVLFGASNWLGSLPLEFYSPESFGFISLFGLPHLAFSRALLLWGLVLYLKPADKFGAIWPGLIWLLAGLFQPLTLVVAWAVIGAHLLILSISQFWQRWKKDALDGLDFHGWLLRGVVAGIISCPIVFYTLIASNMDPVIKEWGNQNLILSPPPGHYLLAYGIVLLVIAVGIWGILKSMQPRDWLLVGWLLIFPLLVYAPYGFQRRLAEGIWVALIALVLLIFENSPIPVYRWMKYVLLLALPSTLFLFTGSLLAAAQPARPLFRPTDEILAFAYLAEHTDGEAVVLSSFDTGNPLPAWAPVFVVLGHGPETVNFEAIEPRVNAFYQAETSDTARQEFLTEFGVDYVFWGTAEKTLGNWLPSSAAYLSLVSENGEYRIYKVDLNGQ